MPEQKNSSQETVFANADNNKYNVANVLYDPERDGAPKEDKEITAATHRIDLNARVGDYVEMTESMADEEAETVPQENHAAAPGGEKHADTADAEQQSADEQEADSEEGLSPDDAVFSEAFSEEEVSRTMSEAEEAAGRHEAVHGEDEFVRDIRSAIREGDDEEGAPETAVRNAVQGIKKPRFIRPREEAPQEAAAEAPADSETRAEELPAPKTAGKDEAEEEPRLRHRLSLLSREKNKDREAKKDKASILEAAPEEKKTGDSKAEEQTAASDELKEALAAVRRPPSICQGLAELQKQLEEGKAPMFHKDEVLVNREQTLALIRSLTNICNADASYIDCAEDALVDVLVSDDTAEDSYKPLERARKRARTIITNAQSQADDIIRDARVLSGQLLAEAESEIREKYDDADEAISARMTTAREESSKKLNEARSQLTSSRQRSVEILNKYMEKAESDYEGYWTRAEHTVIGALKQSDQILEKAEKIYGRELEFIRQDKQELESILEKLRDYRER